MRASLLTLHRLPESYRILYTGILVFILLTQGAGLAQQVARGGLTPAAVGEWWLGNEDDPAATRLLFAKPGAEVLDGVWRRGIADLIPGIVLMALVIRSASRARGALAAGAAVFAVADTLAPAAVRYGGRALAAPALVAQLGLAAVALTIAGLAIHEMWLRRKAGPRFHMPPRPAGEAGS